MRASGGSGSGASSDGVAALLTFMFIIFILFIVIYAIISYYSMKGMCKWTYGDSPVVGILKMGLNMLTSGILGIILSITIPDECSSMHPKWQRMQSPSMPMMNYSTQ
jgi:hypothetical protein